jgi:hypothetical protein
MRIHCHDLVRYAPACNISIGPAASMPLRMARPGVIAMELRYQQDNVQTAADHSAASRRQFAVVILAENHLFPG